MKSRKINNLLNIKSRKNKIKNNSTRRENFSNNNNKTLKNKKNDFSKELENIKCNKLNDLDNLKIISYDDLIKLINNKRVAIIGPADYVNKELTDNHGKYIDSYDIVIRLNSMLKYPEENTLDLSKYYGKKFDILASSFWYLNNNLLLNWDCRYMLYDNYKDISNNIILFEPGINKCFNYVYEKIKLNLNKHNNFYHCAMPKSHQSEYLNYVNKIYPFNGAPTTGFATIFSILLMKPSKLYVSGISFYKDKKHNGYYDYYHNISKEKLEESYDNPKNPFDGKNFRFNYCHNINNEQIFIKYLIDNNLIKVDKYLKNLYK